MINKNKKGFVYFIEIIFTVIIMLIIFSGFIESKQDVFEYKQRQDLRELGWGALKNFDETVTFYGLENLPNYTQESLPNTIDLKMERYNDTCSLIADNSFVPYDEETECGNISAPTKNDIVSVYYTIADGDKLQSVKLYLWRKL